MHQETVTQFHRSVLGGSVKLTSQTLFVDGRLWESPRLESGKVLATRQGREETIGEVRSTERGFELVAGSTVLDAFDTNGFGSDGRLVAFPAEIEEAEWVRQVRVPISGPEVPKPGNGKAIALGAAIAGVLGLGLFGQSYGKQKMMPRTAEVGTAEVAKAAETTPTPATAVEPPPPRNPTPTPVRQAPPVPTPPVQVGEVSTQTPFSLSWFKETPEFRRLLEATSKPDSALPNIHISQAEVEQVLTQVQIGPEDIAAVVKFARPAAKKMMKERMTSAKKILLAPERVNLGLTFLEQNREAVERTSRESGVTTNDLVSMLNTESKFGASRGKLVAVSSFVAQLAYMEAAEREFTSEYSESGVMSRSDNRARLEKRKSYASENLACLLRYAKSLGQDPFRFKGSWAGALGIPQFMPASLSYAADGDGDGIIDLDDLDDALASTAKYLVAHGYRAGDDTARRRSFRAYNRLDEYVESIDEYSRLLGSR